MSETSVECFVFDNHHEYICSLYVCIFL